VGKYKGKSETLLSPNGDKINIIFNKNMITEKSNFGKYKKFKKDNCIGPFIDYLIDIVLSNPPYMRKEDEIFYASFLYDFRNSYLPDYLSDIRNLKIAENKLEYLHDSLEYWIRSYIKSTNPLLSTFALEASKFVLFHSDGYTFWTEKGRGKIPSIVSDIDIRNKITYNKELKTNITRYNLRERLVRIFIPSDCYINSYYNFDDIFKGNSNAFAVIDRCHLSTSYYDNPIFKINDCGSLKYDISENFCFYSFILVKKNKNYNLQKNNHEQLANIIATKFEEIGEKRYPIYLPVRLIKSIYVFNKDTDSQVPINVQWWNNDNST